MVKQQCVVCYRCGDVCFGETIRAYGKYFHIYCFSCEVVGCAHDLLEDGFFVVGGGIYCRKDYHKLMGKKCAGCKKYVEGEVISALEHLYHPRCFRCVSCADVFPPNAEICYDGNAFYCKTCNASSPTSDPTSHSKNHTSSADKEFTDTYLVPNQCVGCRHEIKSGQALIACDKQWHLWCFTCHVCGCLLVGDYMAHDGQPYCEKDYHENFGVVCDYCGGFITGKVLQAGEKCYHPKCSRCAMCGEIFDEGEEMFLQGSQIWHPKCNKNAKLVREKQAKGKGKPIPDDDSDRSSDSTRPPTENYDASRSYNNESSDVVDIDDASHVPLLKRNTVLKSDAELPEDVRRDFYKYLMETDHHHVNRMFEVSPTSGLRRITSPTSNYSHSVSSPGSFRSVNSPSGFRPVNSPNGVRSVKPASNGSGSSSNSFYSLDSPNIFRTTSSPAGAKLYNTPPYPNEEDDAPPPVPPPPTRTSSRKWQQKYSVVPNSQNLRRASFSKAMSPTTEETRNSTLTDSDTFASSVTTSSSTDELNESTERIALQCEGGENSKTIKCQMTTYA